MDIYRFEKLRVYQNAMALVEMVYDLTKLFPREERFALSDQLKRAVVSIVLNIAEGAGGQGDIEYKNFLRIARKSLYETVAALKIAERLFNLTINLALDQCSLVGRELSALIKSLSDKKSKD